MSKGVSSADLLVDGEVLRLLVALILELGVEVVA
jgi:hypothetical protein